MKIEELEAKFKEIDEQYFLDNGSSLEVTVEGNTESSGSLNIGFTRGRDAYFQDNYESNPLEELANAKATEKLKVSRDLLSVNLNDVDIPDEYIQQKVEFAFSRRDKFRELPGVKLSQIEAGVFYRVEEDYTYATESFGSTEHTITALKGYKYDRASIPRIFWVIIDKDSLSGVPPLFHDLLYQNGGVLSKNQVNPYRTFLREEADNLFLELMQKSGVKWWRCHLAYQAVRRFSGFAWKTKIM